MEMVGRVVSGGVYVTVTDVSLILSDVSKTRAAIMFEPGARFTDRVHELVPDAVIHEPEPTLTSTILSPTLSAAVPVTVMVDVSTIWFAFGYVMVIVGRVVSV